MGRERFQSTGSDSNEVWRKIRPCADVYGDRQFRLPPTKQLVHVSHLVALS